MKLFSSRYSKVFGMIFQMFLIRVVVNKLRFPVISRKDCICEIKGISRRKSSGEYHTGDDESNNVYRISRQSKLCLTFCMDEFFLIASSQYPIPYKSLALTRTSSFKSTELDVEDCKSCNVDECCAVSNKRNYLFINCNNFRSKVIIK